MDIRDPFSHILSEKAEIEVDGVVHSLNGAKIVLRNDNIIVITKEGEFDYYHLANSAGTDKGYNSNSLYTYEEIKQFLLEQPNLFFILKNIMTAGSPIELPKNDDLLTRFKNFDDAQLRSTEQIEYLIHGVGDVRAVQRIESFVSSLSKDAGEELTSSSEIIKLRIYQYIFGEFGQYVFSKRLKDHQFYLIPAPMDKDLISEFTYNEILQFVSSADDLVGILDYLHQANFVLDEAKLESLILRILDRKLSIVNKEAIEGGSNNMKSTFFESSYENLVNSLFEVINSLPLEAYIKKSLEWSVLKRIVEYRNNQREGDGFYSRDVFIAVLKRINQTDASAEELNWIYEQFRRMIDSSEKYDQIKLSGELIGFLIAAYYSDNSNYDKGEILEKMSEVFLDTASLGDSVLGGDKPNLNLGWARYVLNKDNASCEVLLTELNESERRLPKLRLMLINYIKPSPFNEDYINELFQQDTDVDEILSDPRSMKALFTLASQDESHKELLKQKMVSFLQKNPEFQIAGGMNGMSSISLESDFQNVLTGFFYSEYGSNIFLLKPEDKILKEAFIYQFHTALLRIAQSNNVDILDYVYSFLVSIFKYLDENKQGTSAHELSPEKKIKIKHRIIAELSNSLPLSFDSTDLLLDFLTEKSVESSITRRDQLPRLLGEERTERLVRFVYSNYLFGLGEDVEVTFETLPSLGEHVLSGLKEIDIEDKNKYASLFSKLKNSSQERRKLCLIFDIQENQLSEALSQAERNLLKSLETVPYMKFDEQAHGEKAFALTLEEANKYMQAEVREDLLGENLSPANMFPGYEFPQDKREINKVFLKWDDKQIGSLITSLREKVVGRVISLSEKDPVSGNLVQRTITLNNDSSDEHVLMAATVRDLSDYLSELRNELNRRVWEAIVDADQRKTIQANPLYDNEKVGLVDSHPHSNVPKTRISTIFFGDEKTGIAPGLDTPLSRVLHPMWKQMLKKGYQFTLMSSSHLVEGGYITAESRVKANLPELVLDPKFYFGFGQNDAVDPVALGEKVIDGKRYLCIVTIESANLKNNLKKIGLPGGMVTKIGEIVDEITKKPKDAENLADLIRALKELAEETGLRVEQGAGGIVLGDKNDNRYLVIEPRTGVVSFPASRAYYIEIEGAAAQFLDPRAGDDASASSFDPVNLDKMEREFFSPTHLYFVKLAILEWQKRHPGYVVMSDGEIMELPEDMYTDVSTGDIRRRDS